MVKAVDFDSKPEKTELPYSVVQDLQTHMKNDPIFYRKSYYPTMCDCQNKIKNGNPIGPIDLEKMIETGVKHYCSKYDIPKRPEELLSKEEKMSLAELIFGEEEELLRNGEY